MSADALAGILHAITAAPALPGARCAGRWQLFDRTIEADRPGPGGAAELAEYREAALHVCAGCPALTPCRDWLARLPRNKRPLGVVAGRLIAPKQPTHEKEPAA